jgi:hypothetical protein
MISNKNIRSNDKDSEAEFVPQVTGKCRDEKGYVIEWTGSFRSPLFLKNCLSS